ncbi:hypothetical protein [Allobaculum sp. Allo2]|nr:hypothetical protein [Allobaculum sp. Allo2]
MKFSKRCTAWMLAAASSASLLCSLSSCWLRAMKKPGSDPQI